MEKRRTDDEERALYLTQHEQKGLPKARATSRPTERVCMPAAYTISLVHRGTHRLSSRCITTWPMRQHPVPRWHRGTVSECLTCQCGTQAQSCGATPCIKRRPSAACRAHAVGTEAEAVRRSHHAHAWAARRPVPVECCPCPSCVGFAKCTWGIISPVRKPLSTCTACLTRPPCITSPKGAGLPCIFLYLSNNHGPTLQVRCPGWRQCIGLCRAGVCKQWCSCWRGGDHHR